MARPGTRRALAAVGLCAAVMLYVFPHFPRINNPNENVRFYMTAALVEEGTYSINTLRERWGWVNDAAVRDGRYFSVKAPGTSLLGVPGYAAYQHWAGDDLDRTVALWIVRVTATILPTLLFLFFFYRWLHGRTRHPVVRDAVFLSVALGSVMLGHAYLFASHTTSAAAAFGAFMILYEARRAAHIGPLLAFVAGLLAAGATLLEYPAVFVSALLCLYALTALRPWVRLAPFVAGAAIPTLAMMHFQWRAFGDPLSPGHRLVENPAFRRNHEEGLFGATEFHGEAAWSLLFDFRLGLLVLTPILVLALPGFVRLVMRRAERLDALVAVMASLFLYIFICFMNIWDGGWAVGPRYLVPIIPFLAWGAAAALDGLADTAPRWAGAVGLGCAAAGIAASGGASMYYPHVPPEIDWPLPHLLAVLVRHDYAPANLGNLLGWHGSASMVPILLVLAFALGWAGWSWRRARDRVVVLASACMVAIALLVPHWRAPPPSPEAQQALAFITRTWHPPGHDRAARLREALEHRRDAQPETYRRLAELYRSEGRQREARIATRAAQRVPVP